MSDPRMVERLRAAILGDAEQHNRERRRDAWISIAVGSASVLVLGVLFFWLAYLIAFLALRWFMPLPPWAFAALASAAFLLAGWLGAIRREDPNAALVGLSEREYDEIILSATFGVNSIATSRFALAGFSELVSGGPRQIIEGRRTLRSSIACDEATVRIAADLLAAALRERSLALSSVPHDEAHRSALVLLRRTLFLLPGPARLASRQLVPTTKALALADEQPCTHRRDTAE